MARTRGSVVEVFADFSRMVACCLAARNREEEYHEIAKRYSADELKRLSSAMGMLVLEMESNPFQDVLGVYYTEIAPRSSAIARGEFYTPQAVGELMAKATIDVEVIIEKGEPFTVSDPCSGSGGLILSLAKLLAPTSERSESYVDLMRVTCIDLNPIAADMCYINTSLWGIPAEVYCGNALSMKMSSGWKNIHWARVGEDQRRDGLKMIRALRNLIESDLDAEEEAETEFDLNIGRDGDQLTFGI